MAVTGKGAGSFRKVTDGAVCVRILSLDSR